MPKSNEQHREECRAYCLACTGNQLANVYRAEKRRAKEGDEVAAIFAEEAEKDLKERNLWPV